MCGRYTRYVAWEAYYEALRGMLDGLGEDGVFAPPERTLPPQYNVAPTQDAYIVIRAPQKPDAPGGLRMGVARFEFVPFFQKGPLEEKKWTSFNAKMETVAQSRAYGEAVQRRRCLVPTSGFYEWRRDGKAKIPYLFQPTDSEVAFFAGVWDRWKGVHKGAEVAFHSFAIVTCEPNPLVAPVHNRMPVIVRPEDYRTWLFGERDEALKVAGPYPARIMRATQVSPAVGAVKNDDPSLLLPA